MSRSAQRIDDDWGSAASTAYVQPQELVETGSAASRPQSEHTPFIE